ncbi:MlaD family protein [Paraconexibacter antarcticus]|uniref:MlaD family protein n=1 Tax=Paraconexibacter antarcticus TaxID=2949664 RepID=A0ABY5DXV2_9ACTN|nr:MlaD family protein [Paraconexibacter antarcticus]UTI66861.1 MlaD family protein [Paraconexibacter antarcticus]
MPFGRLTIIFQAVVAVAFVTYLFASDNVRLPWLSDTYTLHVAFTNAGGLDGRNHNAVLLAGVRVGEVRSVKIAGGRAVATLRMDSGSRGHVLAGTVARVVPRSALEDQTLELAPGRGRALGDGDELRAAPDAAPVPLDRVLATLDSDTRAQLQILLGELDTATKGRATPLGRALASLADTGDVARSVSTKLASRRRELTALVGDMRTVFTTLAERDVLLRKALRSGRVVLGATASQDAQLAETMRRLPAAIDALGGALRDVRGLSAPLAPALSRLRPAARALPTTVSELRTTLPQLRGLIGDLRTLVANGTTPAKDLRRAAQALRPAASGLTPAIDGLLPILRQIDRNRDGVGLVGERFSGVFSTNDVNGPILRGLGFFEQFNPADFGAPGATGPQLRTLTNKVAQALTSTCESNAVACLVRYLVPGLPGAVRRATAPLGATRGARAHALRAAAGDADAAGRQGITPATGEGSTP